MIDRETAQRIKDAADIVEVVSDYVHLVRRGANYMGLCPFHNERTPSFSVNKQRNFCFCFSCKKGGSPVNFIMQKEGLSYHDALLHLAKKYGIEVQEKELSDEERKAQSEREAMLVANEWAMQKMERDIHESEEGRDGGLQYLYQRGVTEEAVRKFHLGYSLDKGYDLVESAKKAGYDINVLKTLGLVGTSQSGRDYDRFRGRVIFPIMNSSGKVIAFGGRDLKGGLAKYINSPESALYKKSNELYGIYQARPEIVKEDKCFLVEGYLDVIGMWQSGMKNVVASSGTALTDGQIALIHRFTSNITLIYDGDSAGIKASLRGIDMLLSHNMHVKLLLLPDGDDPDSFARKHTPEEFRKYVSDHETDIIRFKTRVLLEDVKADPQRRIDAVNSVVLSLAHIPDPISRDVYIQECSSILGMPEETIARSVSSARIKLTENRKRDRDRKFIDQNYPDDSGAPRSNRTGAGQSLKDKQGNGSSDNHSSHSIPSDPTDGYSHLSSVPVDVSQTPEPSRELSIGNSATSGIKRISVLDSNPLYPLEKKLIRYCVRYGYLDFCSAIDENGVESPMNVINYIEEELKLDNLSFTIDIYSRIFSLLLEMMDTFKESLKIRKKKIEEEIDAMRKSGIEEIAGKNLMSNEIEREEKRLEENLEINRDKMIAEYCREYSGLELASYEDDEIREATTAFLSDRQQLSNIYFRNGNVTETEEDRIPVLVPRAITELKSKVLDMKLEELMGQVRQLAADNNNEDMTGILLEINRLHKIRSKIARDIGERVIVPVRKR